MKTIALLTSLLSFSAQAIPGFVDYEEGTRYEELSFDHILVESVCRGRVLWSQRFPVAKKVRFLADTTQPDRGLRVRIENTTEGFDLEDGVPYSDRKYSKPNGSEKINLLPGDEHEGRTFSMLTGFMGNPISNQFRWYVYDRNDEQVDSGDFEIMVSLSGEQVGVDRIRDISCENDRPIPFP